MRAYEKGYADGFRFAKKRSADIRLWSIDRLEQIATTKSEVNYAYHPTQKRYKLGFLSGVRQYTSTERIHYS
jgi:hypothetical protein